MAYNWDFGDHQVSALAHPSHKYSSAGHYTVTVTVTGSGGERASASISVTVLAPGRITRVQMGQVAARPALVISVNGAGRLSVGSHSVSIHGAAAARECVCAEFGAAARTRRPSHDPDPHRHQLHPRDRARRAGAR